MAEEEFTTTTITIEEEISTPEEETKKCTKCNEEKPLSRFQIQKGKPISQCKDCRNARRTELKRQKRVKTIAEKIATGEIIVAKEEGNKYCKYCKTEKPENIFRKGRAKCIDCEREDGRKYRKSDIGKEKSKAWEEANSEKVKELHAKNYQKNKAKINEKNVEKYKNDPVYKMKKKIKSKTMRSYFSEIGENYNKILGCDNNCFQNWIDFCLEKEDDLTSDNYGSDWHFDHVIPLGTISEFDDYFTRDILTNWRNVMPYGVKIISRKISMLILSKLSFHYDNLVEFHKNIN
jgi:hypothetical protein